MDLNNSEISVHADAEQESEAEIHNVNRGNRRYYLYAIICCALFLGICITIVLTLNRNKTHEEYTRMVLETLNAYTTGQRENTLTEIDGTAKTLQSLAVLIESQDDFDFIDPYLAALNEDSPEVKYMYLSEEEYRDALKQRTVLAKDMKVIERLKQGETVVTDLTFSERMGNIYCIGVGVPVVRDGKFIGAVRGIINAESLVSTDVYDPAQGEISAAFLTDGDSVILPIRDANERGVGESLLEHLERNGIEEDVIEELRAVYVPGNSQACSVRLGIFEGSPYYLSLTGLKYNNWHLVVCLKAETASEHFQHILNNTTYSIIGLIIAVILASIIMLLVVRRMQKKFSLDEQRYLLLERFSDTVLFDYDCRLDTIRFTSNASKFLRIHKLTQKDFLQHLNEIYVHADDQAQVRQILSGERGGDSGKIRVRLMRPETDDYFWSLVQYQYLYEKKTPISTIGKITDINEHMEHEDYLRRISETDGLTGLMNKGAAEKEVERRLAEGRKGTLFIIDADGFKQINDVYGHAVGDRALRFLGECIRQTYRGDDVLARIGGDELLIYMEGIENSESARKKAEQLEKYLESRSESGMPSFTVSIGAAQFPADGKNFAELFHAADQAMYAAKAKGKQQICFYKDIQKEKE